MATVTKEKPMTDDERVYKMIADRRALENVAEQILIQHEEGCRFDADEMAVFAELGWDDRRVRQELGRARNVHEAKHEFGSFAHITAAEQNHAKAAAEAKERGAAIREEIARLEAQLKTLDDETRRYQREVESRRAAMNQLRGGLLPSHVREQYSKMRSAVRRSFAHVTEAENRIKGIDAQLAWDPSNVNDAAALDLATSHKLRNDADPFPHGRVNIDRAKWAAWCESLRQERGQCLVEVEDDKPAFEEALAELDAMFDHYTGTPPEGFDMGEPNDPAAMRGPTRRLAW